MTLHLILRQSFLVVLAFDDFLHLDISLKEGILLMGRFVDDKIHLDLIIFQQMLPAHDEDQSRHNQAKTKRG